ncbi:MAG TPA: hypothetical protein VM782_24665 [Stellaceae bacterium]|nr:hypothetical protein [Stellaceae bacterium]
MIGSLILQSLSHALQFLDKGVYLGLCPGIAMVPKVRERIFVACHPLNDLRRHLSHRAQRQAVRDNDRRVSNRDRKTGLRTARLNEVFDPRPVLTHRRRNENRATDSGLRLGQIGHFDHFLARQFIGERRIGRKPQRDFVTQSANLENSTTPAQAEAHFAAARMFEAWAPAFAGMEGENITAAPPDLPGSASALA